MERLETSLTKLFKCSSCLETLSKITTQHFSKSTTAELLHRGTSRDVLVTNRGQVTTEANRLHRMTMQVTSAELTRARLQVCALWKESWFRSSLSYLNVSFTQRTILCTEVTFHDDLVACAHKSRMRTSRSHAQPWQRGISHLLDVKTTGITQCKQSCHVPHAYINRSDISHYVYMQSLNTCVLAYITVQNRHARCRR